MEEIRKAEEALDPTTETPNPDIRPRAVTLTLTLLGDPKSQH